MILKLPSDLSYMVIGYPRSGTAWLANALTVGDSICHHDVLIGSRLNSLHRDCRTNKQVGISDTHLPSSIDSWFYHVCPKVVLHRDANDIVKSIDKMLGKGYEGIFSPKQFPRMDIQGTLIMNVEFSELFNVDTLSDIFTFLGLEYLVDKKRFKKLVAENYQDNEAIEHVRRNICRTVKANKTN